MHQISSLIQSGTFRPEAGSPRLRLPNAKLRKPEPVEADFSTLKDWSDLAGLMPQKAHIEFSWGTVDIEGSHISVNPTEPGEYIIPIPACVAGRTETALVQLTVNPNPDKLLQKEIDPPQDAPYFKENAAVFSANTDVFPGHIFGVSRRGQSHAMEGSFRDDDFRIDTIPEKGVCLFAVADGAGSAKYARQGSKIAVSVAIDKMRKLLNDSCWNSEEGFKETGAIGLALSRAAWESLNAIKQEVAARIADQSVGDVTVHDYNTTLLLSAVKMLPEGKLQIASFAIGDGAIAWWGKNQFALLSEPDSGEYSSETYFLTTDRVWQLARSDREADREAFLKARVKVLSIDSEQARCGSLMLMTDGVSDPFFPAPSDLSNPETWRKFLEEEIRGAAKIGRDEPPTKDVEERLVSWVNFRKRGHFDDRTFVLFELSSMEATKQPDNQVNKVVESSAEEKASPVADANPAVEQKNDASGTGQNQKPSDQEVLAGKDLTSAADSATEEQPRQGFLANVLSGVKSLMGRQETEAKNMNTTNGGSDHE